MSRQETIIGLDVGTANIRCVVVQRKKQSHKPIVIGIGIAPSAGMRKGVVVDIEETTKAISEAAQEAERVSGVPIERVYLSLNGDYITTHQSRGVAAVSRADGEISQEDVARALSTAQATVSLPLNKEIIHVIARNFSIDNQEQIKEPVGMTGTRLEVDTLVVSALSPFIKNLTKCVARANIQIDDLVAAPLAAAGAVLTKRQKELGVVLIDIGAGTTSMAVYEEGSLLGLAVLPVGAGHITNDIAIGLRVSIDVAEKIKRDFGYAVSGEINKKEKVNIAEIDPQENIQVSRRYIAEIIQARLEEIFDLVNKELKKIDRVGSLPGGAILTGGGAKMPQIVQLAKENLRLPVQIGLPQNFEGLVERIDDPSFATALGLIWWAIEQEAHPLSIFANISTLSSLDSFLYRLKKIIHSFLP